MRPLAVIIALSALAFAAIAVQDVDSQQGYSIGSIEGNKHSKSNKHRTSSVSSTTTIPTTTSTTTTTSPPASTTTLLPHPINDGCDPLPLSLPPDQLCDHIVSNCPPSGRLNYLHFYYCSTIPASNDDGNESNVHPTRVVSMLVLLLWIGFLFSCLGLVASDFFCPNLSTLSSRLGMNESTAGVTFLALGNGSPDLFSTFSALSSGSGSLAIGELIGAASFIVSVVAGSMMLIKPFKVRPYPFLRDVGFFTVAVAMTMFYLLDGKLTLAESLLMVGLYLLYASTVIVGSWWEERRRKQRMLWERSRAAYANEPIYQDDDDGSRGDHTPRAPSLLVTDEMNDQVISPTLESGRHLVLPNVAAVSPEYEPRSADTDAQADPFEVWASQQSLGTQRPPRPKLVSSQTSSTTSSRRNSSSPSMAHSHSQSPPRRSPGVITMNQLRRTHSHSRSSARSPYRIAGGGSRGGDEDEEDELAVSSHHHMPRHSLLGAIEFRDVVRSLERGATAAVVVRPGIQRAGTSAGRVTGARVDGEHSRGASTSQVRSDAITGAAMSRDPSMFLPHEHHAHALHHHHPQHQSQQGTDAIASPLLPPPVVPAVEDPWKEHRQGDGCAQGSDSAFSDTFPTLTKLKVPSRTGHSPVPSITISTAPEDGEEQAESETGVAPQDDLSRRTSLWHSLRRALFPSFRHWKSKSHLGRFLSIINAPALLALNLTLPVVDDEAEARATAAGGERAGEEGQLRLQGPESPLFAAGAEHGNGAAPPDSNPVETILDLSTGQRIVKSESSDALQDNRRRDLRVADALRRLPEETSPLAGSGDLRDRDADSECSSVSSTASSTESHVPSDDTKLFLTVAQCLLSPPFCVWASTDMTPGLALVSFGFSLTLAVAVLVLTLRVRKKEQQMRTPAWYHSSSTLALFALSRCFMGFVVSIAWISTVVNEVVAILQALGLICGLSDAILGLTIFAAGNSLADLVADVTIARAGYPVMAISACFAGPLLNLLLGIGLSGSYLMSTHSVPQHAGKHHQHKNTYPIHLSPTLISSGAGLLFVLVSTLVVVPLNDFRLDKRTGWALIAAYVVVMSVNLTVEVWSGR